MREMNESTGPEKRQRKTWNPSRASSIAVRLASRLAGTHCRRSSIHSQ